jgi:hypothetical protein
MEAIGYIIFLQGPVKVMLIIRSQWSNHNTQKYQFWSKRSSNLLNRATNTRITWSSHYYEGFCRRGCYLQKGGGVLAGAEEDVVGEAGSIILGAEGRRHGWLGETGGSDPATEEGGGVQEGWGA